MHDFLHPVFVRTVYAIICFYSLNILFIILLCTTTVYCLTFTDVLLLGVFAVFI